MIKVIGFDIDGVLMDYPSYTTNQFLKLHIEITGKKYDGRILFDKYDVNEMFPDCSSRAVLDATHDAFMVYIRDAPFDPFVKNLFDELHKLRIATHIVTARTSDDEDEFREIESETIKRFKREHIQVDEFHIGFCDKLQIIKSAGIELMVEDSPENIIQLSEYIPVFKMEHAYNKLLFGSNIYSISSLYPRTFIDKIKYMEGHRNYLGMSTKLQDTPAIETNFTADGDCILNMSHILEHVPKFVVPLSGEPIHSVQFGISPGQQFIHNTINLYDIDKPLDQISDPIIRNSVKKFCYNSADMVAGNEMSSDTYILRSKVISDIIKQVSTSKGRYVIYGPQILQLERNELLKLEKCPFLIPNVSDAHKKILLNSRYKKDYKIAFLLEDLDEVSMNIRKLKIIAGLDPVRLPKYVNRQYFTADGIDTVSLLSTEKAYKLENLEAVLNDDTFIVSDVHLSPDDPDKTGMIVESINMVCRPTDKLLFLGDFDTKGHTDKNTITGFLNRLVCKNIYMLLGNNDGFTIDEYATMGFLGITDEVTYKSESRDILLSHCPKPVGSNTLNIHGHLHGGREYWNVDPKNHIDVWDEDFVPRKIRDLIKAYDLGFYRAKSVHMKYV